MSLPDWLTFRKRRSLYDKGCFQWHLEMVEDEITVGGKKQTNPAKTSAIFVVHGIGEQKPTETAAVLRSGFDDALATIQEWQIKKGKTPASREDLIPPPYIRDGYWGDYHKIEETFKQDWSKFGSGQKAFFEQLWQFRTHSAFRIFRWSIGQCLRLLNPRVACELGPVTWILYWPYQVIAWLTLTLALFKAKRLLTGFMGDIRLYVDPQGATERAMAQRIDERVAESFMRMIGLDVNFKSLYVKDYYRSSCRPVTFDRVVWVAHSLGSVISYNVLSDLFRKAEEIEKLHDADPGKFAEEFSNVERFRDRLARFVTIGSPLDKVAYLYGDRALTPWTKTSRERYLGKDKDEKSRRWWVNFYSVFDPVSGALNSEFLFGDTPPVNLHTLSSPLPGYAHVGYWSDVHVLRYVLSRTYGSAMLEDDSPQSWPKLAVLLLAIVFNALVFMVAAFLVLFVGWKLAPIIISAIDTVKEWIIQFTALFS